MKILLLSFCFLVMGSCKKTYTCQCSNSNGVYEAGEVEGTKSQAKKQCKNLSSSATTCSIK